MLQTPQRLHVDVRAPGDTMTVFHPPRDISDVERVFRWFFSVPRWVQLGGVVLVLLVGIAALVIAWRQRHALRQWVRERHLSTPLLWKVVLGLVAIAVLLLMAGSGGAFFVYSQNNNQFCLSCHTLHDEVWQRFQQSKHHHVANLRCHDCHDEPLVAEMRQVAKWILLRPSEVGPHAPVPREVCADCHITNDPDSSWQRIVATAGHSVHVASDTARRLGIECLTCHGVTAHRFVPVAQTCAQQGCHEQSQIRLGKMAGQTSLHCTTCHAFTAPVPETRELELARTALTPSVHNCLGCHAMRAKLARFVPANDPHEGRCGDCHDPHKQETPRAAFATCTNSGCHVRPDTLTPFHRGIHASVLQSCGTCHMAHTWTVKGTACLDCHQDIFRRPPAPVLRSSSRQASDARVPVVTGAAPVAAGARLAGAGDVLPLVRAVLALDSREDGAHRVARGAAAAGQPAAARDTAHFSHAQHRALACTACHSTTGREHGAVRVRTIDDCRSCHHVTEVRRLGGGAPACAYCHALDRLPAGAVEVTARTTVSDRARTRALPFAHAQHASLACADCHGAPLSLAPSKDCTACHAAHHAAPRDCRGCHGDGMAAHRGEQVHLGCGGGGCHRDQTVLALGPTRNVCLSCHTRLVNHEPGGDCAACHRVHWLPADSTRGAAAAPGERALRR